MTAVQPYFSICIPVYNGEKFIQKAVESVLRQTFNDWEMIIIEDGSTDNTWELLVKHYGDHPKIRLLKNEHNLGQRGNLNRCIQEATGQWVGVLPADDFYLPQALEVIHQHTSQQDDLVLWIHSHLCFGQGRLADVPLAFSSEKNMDARSAAELIYLKGNIFGELSSYLVRRSAYLNKPACNFCDGTAYVDARFWLRVLMENPKGQVKFWPEVLAYVLIHVNSDSSKLAAANADMVDFFSLPADLSCLGWRRSIVMLQIARMLKCWVTMGRRLPRGQKLIPFKTIGHLVKRLLQAKPEA